MKDKDARKDIKDIKDVIKEIAKYVGLKVHYYHFIEPSVISDYSNPQYKLDRESFERLKSMEELLGVKWVKGEFTEAHHELKNTIKKGKKS